MVTMRRGWEFVGEIRAVSEDAWQIFDFVVGEVLHIRLVDVSQIQSLHEAE
ncbi:MAG: hypothetical protein ACE5Q3_16950 [Alphaproteobacteria bacterium]